MRMGELHIGPSITKRDAKSLETYLNEIGKRELLTPEEEAILAKKIRESGGEDKEALDKLTEANLRFVVSVAKHYQNKGLSLSDLINEGNLGLIEAAKRFDETKGFKFISYAVWWIRQSIFEALAKKSHMITPPFTNKPGESIQEINKAIGKFLQEHQREPTCEELAEILDIGKKRLITLLNSHNFHSSLDIPIGEDGENTFLDLEKGNFDPPDHDTTKESKKLELERILRSILTNKEYDVITMFFGINQEFGHPVSIKDISDKMGIVEERVRQIKKTSLEKIKEALKKSHKLKNLLKSHFG